jgi:hypothetical protein
MTVATLLAAAFIAAVANNTFVSICVDAAVAGADAAARSCNLARFKPCVGHLGGLAGADFAESDPRYDVTD